MSMAAAFMFFFSLVLVELLGHRACLGGRIPIGSRLLAAENQTWVSENGTFAFGFASMDSPNELLLAIWYARLPGDQTIVWSANRNSPVGRSATLELDATGNLKLLDRNSSIWMSNTSGQGTDSALMADSGSFILYNSTLHVIWESFSYPSDTLLPGQPLTVSSKLTTPNSRGRYYSLVMLQQTTSLSLALTYNSPESDENSLRPYSNYSYWSSPEISNTTGNVMALLDDSGNFGIIYGSDPTGEMYVYKNDDGSISPSGRNRLVLRRVMIERNGNLRLYRWDDDVNGTQQWVVDWAAVSNPCSIAGVCANGICNLNGSKTNASCTCPPGTSLMDPGSVGCSLNSSPLLETCDAQESGFKMATVPQTNYYFSESSVVMNYSDISTSSKCGEYCLSDCDCVASVYGLSEEKPYCWILKSMVFGGFEDPSSTLFIKVGINSSGMAPRAGHGKSSQQLPSGDSLSHREKVLVLPTILCFSVIIAFLSFLLYRTIKKRRLQRNSINLTVPGAPRNFSFRDLQIATSNFSQMLGAGAFGRVYKGSLRDATLIAVKKLERVLPHGEKEFITEVTTIGSMHHVNLVRLCGFCSMGSHRLLVYEFMSNGSLDKWIFPPYNNCNRLLDWKTRFHIAIGTAQGIAYFHEQCRNRIIHCDIKPENILLDDNFCPKVSDFGLAKLMGREHSQVVTMIRGTRGYLAPEWVSNRPITVKADVYSYGMLLLEIIGGRRNVDISLDAEDFFYPGWAFKEMTNGTPMKVADQRLRGQVDEEELVRAINVAFWSIQEDINIRPSMGEVVKMLEGSLDIGPPPMPQSVSEMVEEGLDHVYRAMKREFSAHSSSIFNSHHRNSSFINNTHSSSHATYSYSTMSPR